jgi:hypothetical protein
MLVQNKQATRSCCTRLCTSVKVLQPLKSYLVGGPFIVVDCDRPVAWDCCILILGREVVLAGQDECNRVDEVT